MSDYAKGNVFVGKYKVPKGGHVKLTKPEVIVWNEEGREGGLSSTKESSGPVWLNVSDGEFMPCMIELTDLECEKLINDLATALLKRKRDSWSKPTEMQAHD